MISDDDLKILLEGRIPRDCPDNGSCNNSDLIEELAAELLQRREAERWVPVTKRLPDKNVSCLVRYLYSVRPGDKVNTPWISHGVIEFYSGEWVVDSQVPLTGFVVTHWRPLPEFQQEVSHE